MEKCVLCFDEAINSHLFGVNERINDTITLEQGIRENLIEYSFLIIKVSKSPEKCVCLKCFECFKKFYELLSQIRKNYEDKKIKEEDVEAFPINFCEITATPIDESQLYDADSLKYDPTITLKDCIVEIERFDEKSIIKNENYRDIKDIENQVDSDFEWELDESLKQTWEAPNEKIDIIKDTENEDVKPRKRRKSNKNDEDYDLKEGKQGKAHTYVRYIRQCDITPEILASNQQYVTIDGVEYKIPKRPLKLWRKPEEKLIKKTVDPGKRPHRAHDPEGEQKIKNFVEVKCYICNQPFDAFWRIRKHFKRFHPDQKGYLMCCNRKFTRRYALLDHIEWHDRSKVHSCDVCGKEYKTKKILQQHINVIHLKIVPNYEFMCTHCGKIFKTSSAMKTHQNVSHNESDGRLYECFICHREAFKNVYTLKRHIKYFHDPDSPKYKTTLCHICSQSLKLVSMPHHIQSKHSNEIKEKVKCKICEHWIVKANMRQHLDKHKNNTGAECNVCGKFFKSKLSVYKHKSVVHSDNYKFQCSYCDKKFHREFKMQEHIAVRHTREFPFKCRVEGCGREFRAQANWKIHEKKSHPIEYEKFFKPHYLRSPTHPDDLSANNIIVQNDFII